MIIFVVLEKAPMRVKANMNEVNRFLMVDDGDAKGLPLERIFRCLVQGPGRQTNSSGRHWRSCHIKSSHGNLKYISFAQVQIYHLRREKFDEP